MGRIVQSILIFVILGVLILGYYFAMEEAKLIIERDEKILGQATILTEEFDVVQSESSVKSRTMPIIIGNIVSVVPRTSREYMTVLKRKDGLLYNSSSSKLYSKCNGYSTIVLEYKEYEGIGYYCLDGAVLNLNYAN